jgi:hypothetical protein
VYLRRALTVSFSSPWPAPCLHSIGRRFLFQHLIIVASERCPFIHNKLRGRCRDAHAAQAHEDGSVRVDDVLDHHTETEIAGARCFNAPVPAFNVAMAPVLSPAAATIAAERTMGGTGSARPR